MSTNFGPALKKMREERGFTLKQVAGTAISPNNLSKFEKGEAMIKADTFFKIFENLNIVSNEDIILVVSMQNEETTKLVEHRNDRTLESDDAKEIVKDDENPYVRNFLHLLTLISTEKMLTEEDWEILEQLKEQLFSMDYWLPFDFHVFQRLGTLFDFPLQMYQQKEKEVFEILTSSLPLATNQTHMLVDVLRTIVKYYSENAYYDLAQQLIDKIELYRIKYCRIFLHTGYYLPLYPFMTIKMYEVYNFLRQNKTEGIKLGYQIIEHLDTMKVLFPENEILSLKNSFIKEVKELNNTGIPFP